MSKRSINAVEALAKRCEAAGLRVRKMRDGYRVEDDAGQSAMLHMTNSEFRGSLNQIADLERLGLSAREAALKVRREEERKTVLAADRARVAKKLTTAPVDAKAAQAVRRAAGEYAVYGADELAWMFQSHPAEAARKYDVTPEMAQAMLDHSTRNRKVRERHKNGIRAAMEADRFIFTHQGVAFDTTGEFFDGQHRCLSIVESGKSQRLWVFVGIDVRAVSFVDQHARRSGSDALTMGREGAIKNVAVVSSLVRFIHQYDTLEPSLWKSSYVDNEILVKTYDADADRFSWAARTAGAARQAHKGYNATAIGGLLYLVHRAGASMHEIEDFVYKYKTGEDLSGGHPILLLRRRADLYDERGSGHTVNRKIQFGEWVMAWNAVQEGRRLNVFNHRLDDPIAPITVLKLGKAEPARDPKRIDLDRDPFMVPARSKGGRRAASK